MNGRRGSQPPVPPSPTHIARIECRLCGSLETLSSLGMHMRWNHGTTGQPGHCKECDAALGPDVTTCPLCEWRAQKKWLEDHPRDRQGDLTLFPTWASFGVWP